MITSELVRFDCTPCIHLSVEHGYAIASCRIIGNPGGMRLRAVIASPALPGAGYREIQRRFLDPSRPDPNRVSATGRTSQRQGCTARGRNVCRRGDRSLWRFDDLETRG